MFASPTVRLWVAFLSTDPWTIIIARRTLGPGVMGCMHHGAIELHVNIVTTRDDSAVRSRDLGIAARAILSHAMMLTMSECGLRVDTSRGENVHMPYCPWLKQSCRLESSSSPGG